MKTFISYSSKSRAVVDALCLDLEALGFIVWFDRRLVGGHDWWTEILNGIRHCDLFVFTLTPESIESQPCKLEYEYALALNKRILPIMLQDINIRFLPASLQKLQVIDYRQQDKQQALALGKAFNSLPKPTHLPKPLPTPPEMPLSQITRLRDQIDAVSLKGDEQRLLVDKLKEFLNDDTTANDARQLLRRLREREDLLARTEREIAVILDGRSTKKANADDNEHLVLKEQTFTGHKEAIFCVAYSPSGHNILTGSVDATIRLWNTFTGAEIRQFIGHTGTIWSVAFSPNGRTILSGSRDKTARLWDISTGRELLVLNSHTDSVWGVAYAPDGSTILTGSFDKTARLWDLGTGKEMCSFIGHTAAIWGVAYSPDGRNVLTCSWDKTARLWDIATGKELRCFGLHSSPVVSLACSPDGLTIVAAERDKPASLVDIATGKEHHRFEGHIAFSVAFAPDGASIVTGGGDKTARLWETKTGRQLTQFTGHKDAITSIAYSPDGTTILSGSADKTARLWIVPARDKSKR